MSKKTKSQRLRIRLAGEQNWRCCYCHCELVYEAGYDNTATLDHLTPRSYRSDIRSRQISNEDLDNVAVACNKCNSLKGNRTANVYKKMLERLGGNPHNYKRVKDKKADSRSRSKLIDKQVAEALRNDPNNNPFDKDKEAAAFSKFYFYLSSKHLEAFLEHN